MLNKIERYLRRTDSSNVITDPLVNTEIIRVPKKFMIKNKIPFIQKLG